MPELSPNIVSEVLVACQAGAAEAAEAISRTFDAQFKLSVGEPGTLTANALPAELNAPGLAMVLSLGSKALVLVVPEGTELLPAWYSASDPTSQSKLTTLAQELGITILPPDYMPEGFKTARVDNLAEALKRGELLDGAAMVPLVLERADGKQGNALLIWPVVKPDAVIKAVAPKAEPSPPPPTPPPKPKTATHISPAEKRQFPPFTRSLLRVKVPVVVTLAEKKQTLGRILEMGPGQIIQFDKLCEEMLDLEAGNCLIASGEAVKVGDKFGLRIRSIVPPDERFSTVKARK